jgi:argininosuccinate lyase
MAGLIRTLEPRAERMAAQLEPGLLATDLADYLVKRGVPFRQAHELVGQVVQLAEGKGVALTELTVDELRSISDRFSDDVAEVFDIQASLASRAVPGGTAPEALQEQMAAAEELLRLKE